MGRTSFSGPVAGAYYPLHFALGSVADGVDQDYIIKLPDGMALTLFNVSIGAAAVANTPAVEVGDGTDANGYLTTTNITIAGTENPVDGALSPVGITGNVVVTLTQAAGDVLTDGFVIVHAWVVEHAADAS